MAGERDQRRGQDAGGVRGHVGEQSRLLSQRLKALESAGVIARTVIPTTPVQIRYELTPDGREEVDVLRPLARWSMRRGLGTRGAGGLTDGPPGRPPVAGAPQHAQTCVPQVFD
ncbi:winged helix-turn-helix transcriptional regulator [Streptomyces sp. NPDC051940]|uniref:winged helix-turn-helix transcriptional regulator n=1 Tax=Streptomyces sp. NPDC051940 TaxID=3155675 RepID=UPI0034278541